jgi:ribosomal protein S16
MIRLDLDSYSILESAKAKLNADKLKKRQAANATMSDAVRAIKQAGKQTSKGEEVK